MHSVPFHWHAVFIALREAIKTGRFEKCKAYSPAAGELCVIGQLVLRGTRIVLPSKLRSQAIALAHKGHLGVVGTKKTFKLSIEPLLTFVKSTILLPTISLLYLRRTTMRRPLSYKPHGF